jgi:hypothetical protein
MKVSLYVLAMCVVASSLFSSGYFGTKADSQFPTVHPAISGRNSGFAPPALENGAILHTSPSSVSVPIAAAGDPELPRIYLNTTYVPPTGRTLTVNAGGDFQSALNQALPGDVIVLQAGATFTGNFVLPNKSGTGWITVRTSTPDASFPPQGTRVTKTSATLMPKVISPNS